MKLSVFLLLVLLKISINSDNNPICNVTFEDFFKYDTISFSINGIKILNNVVLESDKSLGVTGLNINIYKDSLNLIAQTNQPIKKYILPNIDDSFLYLQVKMNGTDSSFKIDLKTGKYIGIYKKNNKIKIRQDKLMFTYD